MTASGASFKRNALHTVGGAVGGSALLAILLLVLPKFLSATDYGYYQLYLFYATYLGYLSFGIADGLFLRFSGRPLRDIPGAVVSGHFRALAVTAAVVLGATATALLLLSDNRNLAVVVTLACLSTFFYLLRTLLTFVHQAANLAALFARTSVIERLVHVALAAGVLVFGYRGFVLLLWTDVIARLVGLLYAMAATWELVRTKPLPRREGLRELGESLRGGIFVNLAALATVLVTAASRFAAERSFGVAVFGEISLAFSLQNIVLTIIAPISIVVLPSIRRLGTDRLPSLYTTGMDRLMPLLTLALLAYLPMAVLAHVWLPNFSHLPVYIGILMPMVVFESRTRVFAIPFLQALRRERALAAVNVGCLIAAIITAWLAAVPLDSPTLLVGSLTAVVVARALILEAITQRALGVTRVKETLAEVAVTALFVLAAADVVGAWAWIPAVAAWLGYVFAQRRALSRTLQIVKNRGADATPAAT